MKRALTYNRGGERSEINVIETKRMFVSLQIWRKAKSRSDISGLLLNAGSYIVPGT